MKLTLRFLLISFICISCSKSQLENEFSCSNKQYFSLKKTVDAKKQFSIEIPKHWKINLFYDTMQSSIYFADTTKQLTETIIIDVTQTSNRYQFNNQFIKFLNKNDSIKKLINYKQQQFKYKDKPAFYSISKGKKGKFSYQILNIFIQQNNNNSYHLKAEIYGDNKVNERFCKSLNILNTIQINELK